MRLCKRRNAHRRGRAGQADVRQEGGWAKRGTFSTGSSDINGTSISVVKWHHPPSTPRSQLPTYISICQLSCSCSVPLKPPGFSLLPVIMLNCWDQLVLTLQFPNHPLLSFFLTPLFFSLLTWTHADPSIDTMLSSRTLKWLPASSELSPNEELRFFIAEMALTDTQSSHHSPKRWYRLNTFKCCLKQRWKQLIFFCFMRMARLAQMRSPSGPVPCLLHQVVVDV